MALLLRRGLDVDRLNIVFKEGELVYSVDTKKLYVGDGVTSGGISVSDIIGDTSPQLGNSLDLNTHDIIGFGNIDIDGDITATGTLTIPNIVTDVTGSIFGDDSSTLVDGVNNKLIFSNNSINDFPDVNTENAIPGQVLKYNGQEWVPGNDELGVTEFTGTFTGDIKADDSTLIIDSNTGIVNLAFTSIETMSDVLDYVTKNTNDVFQWSGTDYQPFPYTKVNVVGAQDIVLVNTATNTVNISNNNLGDLIDVLPNVPSVGQVLKWDGANWAPQDATVGIEFSGTFTGIVKSTSGRTFITEGADSLNLEFNSIEDLGDVLSFVAPQIGDLLTWNGLAWEPQPGFSGDTINASVLSNDSTILVDVDEGKLYLTANVLGDLGDIDLTGLQNGYVLKWNGTAWAAQPDLLNTGGTITADILGVNGDILVNSSGNNLNLSNNTLQDLNDVLSFVTPQIGDVLTWNGSSWIPGNVSGDVQGSVFADDSTLLVDAVNGKLVLEYNSLAELYDVGYSTYPSLGEVLVWQEGYWGNATLNLDDLGDYTTNFRISELQDVDLSGLQIGDSLLWNGFNWVPATPEGDGGAVQTYDIQGSVIGADSSVLLDHNTKQLWIDQINVDGNGLIFKSESDGATQVFNVGRKAPAIWASEREDTTKVLANDTLANAVFLTGYEDINGQKVSAVINFYDELITFGHHPNGFVPGSGAFEPASAQLVSISSTVGAAPKLGVGTRSPSQELDVVGNATVAGFMQVGRYANGTARDNAITAPDEGMIVFNQATQKFQGYVADTGLAGGGASNSTPGWVDLY